MPLTPFALILLVPILTARATLSQNQANTQEGWHDVHHGMPPLPWPPHFLLRRPTLQAEKRHQSLLPYHPVVRFRGLGGPGDTWPESAEGGMVYNPLLAGGISGASFGSLDAPLNIVEEHQPQAEGGPPMLHADELSAGDLLTLLESMVGVHEDQGGDRVIKSVRFGATHRRR